jgi:hypothetical protein
MSSGLLNYKTLVFKCQTDPQLRILYHVLDGRARIRLCLFYYITIFVDNLSIHGGQLAVLGRLLKRLLGRFGASDRIFLAPASLIEVGSVSLGILALVFPSVT